MSDPAGTLQFFDSWSEGPHSFADVQRWTAEDPDQARQFHLAGKPERTFLHVCKEQPAAPESGNS